MAVNLSPIGGVAGQFFDNNGNPLVGGKLFTYAAGTTTPQVTFTSALGNTPNSNPIILNGGGRVPAEIWLTDGLEYKFVLLSSTDQLIGAWDNITGINSNFVNFVTSEEVQTATAGQTVFTLTTMSYQPGTNNLVVYVDGVNQIEGSIYSFVETSSTVVTFTTGLHVGALVKFVSAETLTGGATSANLVSYQPAGVGAVATNVQTKLRETVSVKDFGAVGDGVADDTAAIQAAVDFMTLKPGGQVLFPVGAYLTTATINVPDGTGNSINLVGESYQRFSQFGGSSIIADHSAGPVIRFSGTNQGIRYLNIRSSASRTSGAAGTNFGVLVERPDAPGNTISNFVMEEVGIFNQPNSGFVTSGALFRLRIVGGTNDGCKGHAYVIDQGGYTGRTNRGRPGAIVIIQPRIASCTGHTFLIGFGGNPGTSFGAFRVYIIDGELVTGLLDPSLDGYKGLYNAAISGDSVYTQNTAFDGPQAGTPNVLRAMYLTGWSHRHSGNRYISCDGVAFIQASNSFNAFDMVFENSYVTGTYDPAITFANSGGAVVDSVYWQGDTSGITSVFQAGIAKPYLLDSNALDIGFRPYKGRQIVLTATPDAAFSATRANAQLYAEFTRTGTGANVARVGAIGGLAVLESGSPTDVAIRRDSVERFRVKSNTINISSIPTSPAGLVTGDLWSDGGTIKIVS